MNPDDEIVKLQWLDGEIEEIDLDAWTELDLELAEEPEGWADEDDDDDDDDDDWDEDEDDWDDDGAGIGRVARSTSWSPEMSAAA